MPTYEKRSRWDGGGFFRGKVVAEGENDGIKRSAQVRAGLGRQGSLRVSKPVR